jgi:3-deoxy-manno-octulosonate cytidylyltransferase (CMP-KDO synthetase)
VTALVVIPARLGSTRFPAKPLALLAGRPLVAHVVARALQAQLGPVWVATDDARIAQAAERAGASAVLTSSAHPSGTDRVAEAVRRIGPHLAPRDVVVNLQGDEPLIEPAALHAVVGAFARDAVEMATAAAPLDPAEAGSPHVVKVVCDAAGRALYFSRALIPHGDGAPAAGLRRRHLGLYAYRRATLQRLAALPPCATEQVERLEQLRALHHGIAIHVVDVPRAWRGVDTPEDLAALAAELERTASP